MQQVWRELSAYGALSSMCDSFACCHEVGSQACSPSSLDIVVGLRIRQPLPSSHISADVGLRVCFHRATHCAAQTFNLCISLRRSLAVSVLLILSHFKKDRGGTLVDQLMKRKPFKSSTVKVDELCLKNSTGRWKSGTGAVQDKKLRCDRLS